MREILKKGVVIGTLIVKEVQVKLNCDDPECNESIIIKARTLTDVFKLAIQVHDWRYKHSGVDRHFCSVCKRDWKRWHQSKHQAISKLEKKSISCYTENS